MSSPQTTASDLGAVADAIRSHDRFLVTTHENPDGDALGLLLAAKLALDALGKDAVMYLYGEAPLPREYTWMPLEDLRRAVPDDCADRVLLALDCANESRLGPDPEVLHSASLVVNLDHHHDNTRFGNVNCVVADASSTGEIVRDLLRELDVALTPDIAEALYIALVTDTGRFQYTNTTPKALRLAAELVEAGADVHKIFQDVYESVQFAKMKLLARALERLLRFLPGLPAGRDHQPHRNRPSQQTPLHQDRRGGPARRRECGHRCREARSAARASRASLGPSQSCGDRTDCRSLPTASSGRCGCGVVFSIDL